MPRKIPRGKGYDKAATLKHLKKMKEGGSLVTDYVKQQGLKLDTFILATLKHSGGYALDHVASDPKLLRKQCEECQEDFWPTRKTARFCSPSCNATFNRDKEYFGGKRKTTVGLAEGMCGLCQRKVTKGLSSHHLYGKANDPGNDHLLALCSGCHQIVSDLALKTWCVDELALERLVVLAASQRRGKELMESGRSLAAYLMLHEVPLDPDKPS